MSSDYGLFPWKHENSLWTSPFLNIIKKKHPNLQAPFSKFRLSRELKQDLSLLALSFARLSDPTSEQIFDQIVGSLTPRSWAPEEWRFCCFGRLQKVCKPGPPPQFHTNMVSLIQALFQLKRSFENQFWDKPYKSFTKVWTALMMVIPYPCLHAPLQEQLGGAGAHSFFVFGFSCVGWWTQESLQLPTNIW